MLWTRLICLLIIVLSGISAHGQESEIKPSSATDAGVKIHRGKRVRATKPSKEFKPRFNDKSKKVVNVKESSPKVQKHNVRRQKRNSKFQRDGK